MGKSRTWKQMKKMLSSQERSSSLFLKEELPESRSIVRNSMAKKQIIDFESHRSSILNILGEEEKHISRQ